MTGAPPQLSLTECAPQLATLLGAEGLHVRHVQLLSKLDAPRRRTSSYRLDMVDGAVLKGRIAWDAARAQRIEDLLNLTDAAHFPHVLARHDRALLLPWIDGGSLPEDPEPGLFTTAGRVLSDLHQLAPPPDYRASSTATMVAEHAAWIDLLEKAQALSSEELHTLREWLGQVPFPTSNIGITHHDYCAENIVLDSSGAIRVVDNEGICAGYLSEDLARVWYRWPMSVAQREQFLQGYQADGHGADHLEHFEWWTLRVALGSARYRLGSSPAAATLPLSILRSIMTSLKSGSPLPLFFREF